jgi:hypothetical protein
MLGVPDVDAVDGFAYTVEGNLRADGEMRVVFEDMQAPRPRFKSVKQRRLREQNIFVLIRDGLQVG